MNDGFPVIQYWWYAADSGSGAVGDGTYSSRRRRRGYAVGWVLITFLPLLLLR